MMTAALALLASATPTIGSKSESSAGRTTTVGCPHDANPVVNYSCPSNDLKQVHTTTPEACQAACCAEPHCLSFGFNSDLPAAILPPVCSNSGHSGPCCWLKKSELCAYQPSLENCSMHGIADCKNAGGSAGRPLPPAPAPPSPESYVCPEGFILGSTSPDQYNMYCVDPNAVSGTPPLVARSFDCEMRRHAWEFAKRTLPRRGSFRTVFDALRLQECNVTAPPVHDVYTPPRFATPSAVEHVFWVDANASYGGSGSKTSPFVRAKSLPFCCASTVFLSKIVSFRVRSIPHQVKLEVAVEAAAESGPGATIILRAGRHYTGGIVLTARHAGLTIQNFEGEHAVIAGAVRVPVSKAKWMACPDLGQKCPGAGESNTWRLDLSGWADLPAQTFGMRIGTTKRATRARWPNGDFEVGTGVTTQPLGFSARKNAGSAAAKNFFAHPEDYPGVYWLSVPEGGSLPNAGLNMAGTGSWFDAYGGLCSGKQAPFGFWCSGANPRTNAPNDYQAPYEAPGGFSFDSKTSRVANWSKPVGAVFHFHAGFCELASSLAPLQTPPVRFTGLCVSLAASMQCLVSGVTTHWVGAENTSVVNFDEQIGCDQSGVNAHINGWYVDNVKEECDWPGEYYLDAEEKALYYVFNGTESPAGDEDLSLITTKVIFNVSGTQAAPVTGVTIRGLTIRDAALTYLGTSPADVHYIPSDSDWAINRGGAVLLEGTEDFRFEGNEVTRCDGNGVFLSNYNRNTSLIGNDFSWIGASAMQGFGSMGRCLYANCSVRLNYTSGVDGRGGNQPRYTTIVGNLVREVGLHQHQSAAWASHLAARTLLDSNVMFNMPQTAIGFNDGVCSLLTSSLHSFRRTLMVLMLS